MTSHRTTTTAPCANAPATNDPGRYLRLDRLAPRGGNQEILQGARSQSSLQRLAEYFGSQRFYWPSDPLQTHRDAAALDQACRAAGVTIRSTIDCFIAQLAIEHDLVLLHGDRDFERMAEIAPDLRLHTA